MQVNYHRLERRLLNFVILLLIFLHTITVINIPMLNNLERTFSDFRLKLSQPKVIDNRIVIADIDEASIVSLGRWPWNRDLLAQLTDVLFDHYQIKVLGLDMLLSEANESGGLAVLEKLDKLNITDINYHEASRELRKNLAFDQIFAQAISERNVVLGMVFDQHDDLVLNTVKAPIKKISPSLLDKLSLIKPLGFSGNINTIHQAVSSVGFFDNPNIEIDGLYRKIPLIQVYNNGLYPSLALAVTRKALDDPDYYIKVEQIGDYAAIEQIQLGNLLLPVDESGSATIAYRGGEGSFPYLSVRDIINKSAAIAQLKDKIVLLGTSAPGLQDLRATPVDNALPGVEIHANMISAILDQRLPHQPAYIAGIEAMIIIAIGLLLMIFCNFCTPKSMILLVTSLVTIYSAANLWLWQQGVIIFLAPPLLLIFSTFVVNISWGFIEENRVKKTVTGLFGHYVPPELVEEMVEKPELATQEGKSLELTVLFADVRNFTNIAESIAPHELSELLNLLLTPLTKVIHDNRGTIDKYMGDCIMAFWGAPVPEPQHANFAICSALEMLQTIAQLQAKIESRGWPEIKIGIGLNTGTMSVGNMGSEYRTAYTVLGDAVNLGSRLESLTKQYGVSLIVSEFTKNAAPNFVYRELDLVRVKGKDKAVAIFEVVTSTDKITQELESEIGQFHQVLRLYRAKEWTEALVILDSLMKSNQQKSIIKLYQEYYQRIVEYQKTPPVKAWDGVYVHATK